MKMKLTIQIVVLMCFLCTCSTGVLHSPVLEESPFQNETAIQVDWQFGSDQPVSNFIVMATGKFFDNNTREETKEGSVRSVLLTELKSGETYIITVVAVNGTESSTSRELEVNTMVFALEIEVVSSSLSTLSFRWSLPPGERAKTFIAYLVLEGTLTFQQTNLDGDTFYVTFYNLTSSDNYELSVFNYGYNDQIIFSSSYYSTDIPNIFTSFLSISNTYFTIKWWGEDLLFLAGPFLVEYYGQNIDTLERNKTVESSYRSTDVAGLLSGETYIVTVSMSTKVSTKTSNLTSVTTALYVPTFNDHSQTTTTLTLTWSSNNDFVEVYQLTYGGVELETTERTWNVSGNDSETTITGLTPGVEYRVKIVAISNAQTSPSDTLRISTMPGPVENLVVMFNSADYLRADWDQPSLGYVENYEVAIHNSTSIILTYEIYANGYEYLDSVLEEMYTVYVTSLAKDGERSITKSARTGVTTSVADVAHDVNETTIKLTWTPPTDTFTFVRVTCSGCVGNNEQEFYTDDLPLCIFTGIAPGSSNFVSFETFLNGESISPKILLIISTTPRPPTIAVPSTNDIGLDFIELSVSDYSCNDCTYKGWATSELGHTLDPEVVEPGSSHTTFQMRFEQLQPGTRYNISIVTELNRLMSSPAEIYLNTNLAMPRDIIWSVNSSSVTVSWKPPLGLYDVLILTCYCGQTYTVSSGDAPMAIFNGLGSGSSYFFNIETMRDEFETASQLLHIFTAPEPPDNFEISKVETTSISFLVTDNDCTGCIYTVTAMSSESINHTAVMHDRIASETRFIIELNDLIPGTDYFIELIVTNSDIDSSVVNLTTTTVPLGLQTISFGQVTTTGFTIYWDTPEGNLDGYIITLEPKHALVPTQSNHKRFYKVENLEPYTQYIVTVVTLAGSSISASVEETVTTLQGIPGPVTNIDVQISVSSAIVRFNPPLEVFGVLEGYSINQIGHFYGLPSHTEFRLVLNTQILNVFENILPGYNYSYTVQAKNADNFGTPTYASITVPPNEPEPSNVKPEQVPTSAITNSSFTVVINDLLFDENNGPVSTFVVIVAEQQGISDSNGGETGETQDAVLPSWGQAIKRIPTPRYQTSKPFNYSDVREVGNRKRRAVDYTINIGSDDCSSADASDFCNGPLKPGTTYVYQFRGYYGTDYYADTLYSEPITLNDDGESQTEEDDKNIVVIAVVLGVVIFVLIGLMVILVYSYRTKNRVMRTIVGKDGTFREPITIRQDINLVSMKLRPEERWDQTFAMFESDIMQEQKGSTNISIENIAETSNGHAETEAYIQDEDKNEEPAFVEVKNEEASHDEDKN